jgi:hypothetical protein
MPTICRFYGITIRMYFRDHPPPHFHAIYGDDEALIDIQALSVLAGHLPGRAAALVLEWAALRQDELMHAWDEASRHNAPGQIQPLD